MLREIRLRPVPRRSRLEELVLLGVVAGAVAARLFAGVAGAARAAGVGAGGERSVVDAVVGAAAVAVVLALAVLVVQALRARRGGRERTPSSGRTPRVHPGLSRPGGTRPRAAGASSSWARAGDLGPLRVGAARGGRLTLGFGPGGLLAAEARQSVIVIGPTQSRKTTGLAIPAILEWEGPVLATSVKADLAAATLTWRAGLPGAVTWCFDPTGATGLPRATWSPLDAATTWGGARRVAHALCAAARTTGTGMTDAEFWYTTAAKLLAPLLFAASRSGRTMADVVSWVDTQETDGVLALLESLGVAEACDAAIASWSREERTRSSVYTTAETVLDAFASLAALDSPAPEGLCPRIDVPRLVDGGPHTLYVCAPLHEQRRYRPLLSALVSEVLAAGMAAAAAAGGSLPAPLLVVLDEAANIAPVEDLDALAATAAGQGIQLLTVWQDLAQILARYGERGATVVNNHRAKVILSGISDPRTLEQVSGLLGDSEVPVRSVTTGPDGRRSSTASTSMRRLASADALRRLRPGEGVLVYGHLPPARLRLRPYFADRALRRRAPPARAPTVASRRADPQPGGWPRPGG